VLTELHKYQGSAYFGLEAKTEFESTIKAVSIGYKIALYMNNASKAVRNRIRIIFEPKNIVW
jgi:hypothetical protein